MDTELLCDEGTALEVEKRDGGEEPGMDLVSVNCALRLLKRYKFYKIICDKNKSQRRPVLRVWKQTVL